MIGRDASNGSEEHLLELLMQWREGTESERESARRQINDLMRADDKHRAVMARLLVDETLIDQELRMQSVESLVDGSLSDGVLLPKRNAADEHRNRSIRLRFVIAASVIASVAWSLFSLTQPSESGQPGIRVTATEGVGTLDIVRLQRGDTTVLKRGILELELNGEARVVFEAPATFNVISPRRIRLSAGRCFAEMDEGKSGLIIETPSGEALDLGTRFAVHVPSPQKMEVHVFDGAVEVSNSQGTTQLVEGQGLALEETGNCKELTAQPGNFVSHVPRSAEIHEPFLYWSFDEGDGDEIAASGRAADAEAGHGILHTEDGGGPTFVPGVSGTALKFDGKSQWVGTGHPGISGDQDRTVACWVRLPVDWEKPDKAPILSWGLVDSHQSGKGWMLSVSPLFKRHPEYFGRLRLSVGEQQVIGTSDLRDGRGHHVAAIVAGDENGPAALLYVDGKLENVTRNSIELVETETASRDAEPIRFGRQIFWDKLFMRGSLDEVYLFDAALSGDQIRSLMESNELDSVVN